MKRRHCLPWINMKTRFLRAPVELHFFMRPTLCNRSINGRNVGRSCRWTINSVNMHKVSNWFCIVSKLLSRIVMAMWTMMTTTVATTHTSNTAFLLPYWGWTTMGRRYQQSNSGSCHSISVRFVLNVYRNARIGNKNYGKTHPCKMAGKYSHKWQKLWPSRWLLFLS